MWCVAIKLMVPRALSWEGLPSQLCFLRLEFFVRLKSFRRLFADDSLVLIAWLMLASNAFIWQLNKMQCNYTNMALTSEQLATPLKKNSNDTERYQRALSIIIVFFYSSL